MYKNRVGLDIGDGNRDGVYEVCMRAGIWFWRVRMFIVDASMYDRPFPRIVFPRKTSIHTDTRTHTHIPWWVQTYENNDHAFREYAARQQYLQWEQNTVYLPFSPSPPLHLPSLSPSRTLHAVYSVRVCEPAFIYMHGYMHM